MSANPLPLAFVAYSVAFGMAMVASWPLATVLVCGGGVGLATVLCRAGAAGRRQFWRDEAAVLTAAFLGFVAVGATAVIVFS